MRRRSTLVAVAGLAAVLVSPLGAQAAPAVITSWSPFLGCWSTSSAGVIGVMVCIVPTDSSSRVEFLSVFRDSVVGRTFIDASGRTAIYKRGPCRGAETARWSIDRKRVFVSADYFCDAGRSFLASGVFAFTHLDAFTYVEADDADTTKVPRVVNFIVQLDTTLFPAEVKRRLSQLRPLVQNLTELETVERLSMDALIEATTELPARMAEAWLGERGESAIFAIADRKRQRVVAQQRIKMRLALAHSGGTALFSSANLENRFLNMDDFFRMALVSEVPAGRMATPSDVGFGLPYDGYAAGMRWGGHWP